MLTKVGKIGGNTKETLVSFAVLLNIGKHNQPRGSTLASQNGIVKPIYCPIISVTRERESHRPGEETLVKQARLIQIRLPNDPDL